MAGLCLHHLEVYLQLHCSKVEPEIEAARAWVVNVLVRREFASLEAP